MCGCAITMVEQDDHENGNNVYAWHTMLGQSKIARVHHSKSQDQDTSIDESVQGHTQETVGEGLPATGGTGREDSRDKEPWTSKQMALFAAIFEGCKIDICHAARVVKCSYSSAEDETKNWMS